MNENTPTGAAPMQTTTEAREIKISYRSVDRFSKSAKFKTLKGARKFAHNYVGPHPEMGGWYAVSADGIGRVTVEGATLEELFPSPGELTAAEDAAEWAALSDDELAERLEWESEAIYWQNVDRANRATCGWSPNVDRAASRELARRNALRPVVVNGDTAEDEARWARERLDGALAAMCCDDEIPF